MKRIQLFLFLLLSGYLHAQQPIPIRNLWARPQVHVVFGEYTVSFTIRDINKALQLLRDNGQVFATPYCGLDTSKNYYFELYPGSHAEYKDTMQPLLQNQVAAFLLSAGRAEVMKNKKPLGTIIMDLGEADLGEPSVFVSFFDPKSKTMLFSGKMPVCLYKKDIGIDDD